MSSKRREARKATQARSGEHRLARRRQALRELLSTLGFTRASTPLLDALLARRYPAPAVVLTSLASECGAAPDVVEAVRKALTESFATLAPFDTQVRLATVFTEYLAIADACAAELISAGNVGPSWGEFARVTAPHREQNFRRSLRTLTAQVDNALLPHCRFSEDIYFARYTFEASSDAVDKPRLTVVVDVHRAKPVVFEREGKPRPAGRCGLPFLDHGIEWVRWTRATPGFGSERADADVYLQSHAIQRLEERLCLDPSGLTDWVWQSLREPVLLPQTNGWLVEFRVAQWRLGYFCAEDVGGKILVTTFLFLTNAGTPEGHGLRERTRFRTDEIAWLKMDELSYFLLSDVQNDLELRALFAECGCGHLFEMMKPEARTSTSARANATRRHLQMPPSSEP